VDPRATSRRPRQGNDPIPVDRPAELLRVAGRGGRARRLAAGEGAGSETRPATARCPRRRRAACPPACLRGPQFRGPPGRRHCPVHARHRATRVRDMQPRPRRHRTRHAASDRPLRQGRQGPHRPVRPRHRQAHRPVPPGPGPAPAPVRTSPGGYGDGRGDGAALGAVSCAWPGADRLPTAAVSVSNPVSRDPGDGRMVGRGCVMRVQASVVAPGDGPWCGSWPARVGRGLAPRTSAHTLARATQLRWNRRSTQACRARCSRRGRRCGGTPSPRRSTTSRSSFCSPAGKASRSGGPVGSSDTTSTGV
jgi:hypothetical protein